MEKKTKKQLTEFEKKYILEEVKRTKEINAYLATTKMKVATYQRPKTKKGGEENGKN